jgi:FtsZ-binding cell division protein ZapB
MEAAAPQNELRDELNTRISSLKKQTIVFLLLTILTVFYAIYLSNELKESNNSLLEHKERLEKTEQKLAEESESWRILLTTNNQKWQDSLQKITLRYSIPAHYGYANSEKLYVLPNIIADYQPTTESLKQVSDTNTNRVFKIKTTTDLLANRIIVPKAEIISEAKIMNRRNYLGYLVYIQAINNSKYSKSAQNILRARGFTVPGIETMPKVKQSGILYFHENDKPIADSIRNILVSSLGKTPESYTRNFRVINRTNIKAPKGQLEIWLGQ